jgi:ADP-ribose pyrophosphatase YjhB (NUDIX family)
MNSQLQQEDKQYPIHRDILNSINAKYIIRKSNSDGSKRANNLLKTKYLTYSTLKRLKNFFDYLNPVQQREEFELVGGEAMRQFVEKTLQSERNRTNLHTQNKVVSAAPSAMDNTLRGASGDVNMDLSEAEIKDSKKRGALAVIVNEENKVLIVKRAPFRGSWMPNKHALVGGGIEQGEEPIDAARREVNEESGLKLNHFVDSFNIISPPNTVDFVFIAKAPENQEVKLNEEHTEHGWYSLDEIKELDSVPMLYECIELALNKMKEKSIYKK